MNTGMQLGAIGHVLKRPGPESLALCVVYNFATVGGKYF
jgi:hypothetical protein